MKTPSIFLVWLLIGFSVVSSVSAATIDTSLISDAPTTAPQYQPEKFTSCTDMRNKIADFMELYYSKYPPYNYGYGYGGGIIKEPMSGAMTPSAIPSLDMVEKQEAITTTSKPNNNDYSSTNTRTVGIDEPEKVKTDGKYLYTSRIEDHAIYINKADDSLELVTKIVLPNEYNSAEIFVDQSKLILLATKSFWNESFRASWIDRSTKTVVVIYDISNVSKPLIERYSQIDGYVREARMKDGQLTLLTTVNFNFPYDRYFPQVNGTNLDIDMKKLSAEFSTNNVLPRKIEFTSRKISGDIDTTIAYGRKFNRVVERNSSNCSNVSYILPNEDTLTQYSFQPTFTAITSLNTRSALSQSTTTLMFGDVNKAYLSASNTLYISNTIYSRSGWNCPPGAMCIARWIEPGSQTVVHQFNAAATRPTYLRTGVVPGNLISDYAIDESANGEVRLVTQMTGEERESVLTILAKDLTKVSQLTGLGKGENFQSSRFIGNRLYLVTFEQIDPLYVIDLTDSKNPKVLGELKIPGYSTYLHPYDNDRLIGIGYDTKTNEWGGTTNAGVKIDLYNVADVKNPKQEATLTLGGVGSYSEALSNPRLFVWQKSKNMLYLPVQLYTSNDKANPYNYTDAFQGVVAVEINPVNPTKVREIARTTHLKWNDAELTLKRDQECKQYVPKEKVCRKLITGEEVCTEPSSYNYIPNYCYADVGLGAYKVNLMWQQSERFIDRVMYSGNRTFTFSRAQIESLDNTNGLMSKGKVEFEISKDPGYGVVPLMSPGIR